MPLYVHLGIWEGLRNRPYICTGGKLTIGIGHTGPDVRPGIYWTNEKAYAVLQKDVRWAFDATLKHCPVLALPNNLRRLHAMVSFTFNLGEGNLARSGLKKKVNAQDWKGASQEIMLWVYSGGRRTQGLVNRRRVEAAMLRAEVQ